MDVRQIRIGIGQIDFKIGDLEYNLESLQDILDMAKEVQVDILVLPELANSGYYFESKDQAYELAERIPTGSYSQALIKWSAEERMVVAGINELGDEGLYNSAAIMANGEHLATYRKYHLWGPEKDLFLVGPESPLVLEYGGMGLSVIICYEWNFPERVKDEASEGAQLILHPLMSSNYRWQDGMKRNARTNGVYTASANRVGKEGNHTFSGGSTIIDPKGKILLEMDATRRDVGWSDISL